MTERAHPGVIGLQDAFQRSNPAAIVMLSGHMPSHDRLLEISLGEWN
jgi:hypothetical protein